MHIRSPRLRGTQPSRPSSRLALVSVLTAALAAATMGTAAPRAAASVPTATTATCTNAAAGWTATEEAKTGDVVTPDGSVRLDVGAVQGYLDSSSTECGVRVGLHLSSPEPTTAYVDAVRIGGYSGAWGRRIWTSGPITVATQPIPAPAPHQSSILSWPTSTFVTPTAAWPPGFYVLRIRDVNYPDLPSWVPLVVRTSGVRAPMAAISSDLTHLAYNAYGGTSLYAGPGDTPTERFTSRAYTVSPRRPLSGSGITHVFTMDAVLARLAGQERVAVDWTTDSSFDRDPSQLTGYASALLPGHSEYWTKKMYDALTVMVDGGTHLGVLGANEIYWQARTTFDTAGNLASMTVYRDAALDPVADPTLETVKWSEYPLVRPPAALTGLGFSGIGVSAGMQLAQLPPWVEAGGSLQPGAYLPVAFANEGDGPLPPGGASPTNLTILARGLLPGTTANPGGRIASSYYLRPSGAIVFNAGVTCWLAAIYSGCPGYPQPPASTGAALRQLTAATLKRLSDAGSPRLGDSYATPWISHDRLLTILRAAAARSGVTL